MVVGHKGLINRVITTKAGIGLGLSISKEILELRHAVYGENTKDGVRFFFSLLVQP
ncbi:hypothetical protein DSECCO2_256410 [anaerobic digester metagenome]